MKTALLSLIFLLLLSLLARGQYQGTAVTLTPAKPRPGQTITVTYSPAGTKLAGATNPSGIVYWIPPKGDVVARDFTLRKKGTIFQATLTIPDTVASLAMTFEQDNLIDNNGGKAYDFLLYNSAGNVLDNSYGSLSILHMLSYLTGNKTDTDMELAGQLLKKEQSHGAKRQFMSAYLYTLDGKPEQIPTLAGYAALPNLTTDEQETIRMYAMSTGQPTLVDSIGKYLDQTYGKYFDWSAAYEHFRDTLRTLAEKKAEFATIREQATKPGASSMADHYYRYSHSIYLKTLADSAQWSAFQELIDQAPASFAPNSMGAHNAIAWDWATRGRNLEKAAELAKIGTAWAKGHIKAPREPNDPTYQTDKQLAEARLSAYGTYADTYGYVLLKQGMAAEALPYLKEAVAAKKRENIEINERYAQALAQVDPAAVPAEIERFILDKKSSKEMEEVLKKAYVTTHGNASGFDSYLAAIKDKSKEQLRNLLRQKRIQQPAPAFSLLDLEGKSVSLADLKGKTVVVDFWATWCGPCLASFPIMQQAVDTYKNDPNIAFVFINAWQREADKKKVVSELLAQKGYTFHVLMDEKDQVISDFKVAGIPTKFIIDKAGQIRFKSLNSLNGADAILEELALMIALANEPAK